MFYVPGRNTKVRLMTYRLNIKISASSQKGLELMLTLFPMQTIYLRRLSVAKRNIISALSLSEFIKCFHSYFDKICIL